MALLGRGTYLALMAACVLVTLPLELALGARVWRRPQRLLATVLPVLLAFGLWDRVAIGRGHWWYDRRWVTGWHLAGLPVEEVVFFLVVPTCAILTYEAVRRVAGARR